jgi:hypothetical protein
MLRTLQSASRHVATVIQPCSVIRSIHAAAVQRSHSASTAIAPAFNASNRNQSPSCSNPSAVPSRSFSSSAAASTKPPTRRAVLSTYRQLLRAIHRVFYTSSQYASFDELSGDSRSISGEDQGASWRREQRGREDMRVHADFAGKRSSRWLQQVREAYRSAAAPRQGEDATAAKTRRHREAEQLLTMLVSNMEHSRYLLEGGWGIRRNTYTQLSNVAHKVGLQMPKETAPLVHQPAGAKHQKARDAILYRHDKFVK